MRFRGLDLNLLVALRALIELRSVSQAAQLLNLTQPAVSAALGRLRDYFGDPILVQNGNRMFPTAYAEALLPQIRETLNRIDALIISSAVFDPKVTHRTFRIATSDYIVVSLLVPLIERLAIEAPHIRIETLLSSDDSVQRLSEGRLDLLIAPEEFVSKEHPADLLVEEHHVVAGWSRNPVFDEEITADVFFACGHVVVEIGQHQTPAFADRHVAALGRPRRIEATAASFATVPWLLRGTNRIAVMHERLFKAMAELFPIRSAPLPFDFPVMREMAQYHSARATDEGLRWLLGEMRARAGL